MTTVNITDGRGFAFTKGAMESVLPLCSSLLINGEKIPLNEVHKKQIIDAYHSLMDSGLRVLILLHNIRR